MHANQVPLPRLTHIIQKKELSSEDAQFVYENIRGLPFFEGFSVQYLRTFDYEEIVALFRGFKYESMPAGSVVFKSGDESNDKFYVIFSGQVAIIKKPQEDQPKTVVEENLKKKKKKRLRREDESISKRTSVILIGTSSDSKILRFKTAKSVNEDYFLRFNTKGDNVAQDSQEDTHNLTMEKIDEASNFFIGELNSADEEEDIEPVYHEGCDFENFSAYYGKIVRFLDQGESFGELALINNAPRSASVLCSKDCEFMVISKEKFDMLYYKKSKDKETFFETTFPVLENMFTSSSNINFLLYSFKTESYSKGTYLTLEGEIEDSDKKFFIIYQGECTVEQFVEDESESPTIQGKKGRAVTVAKIGKGMVFGEELLLTKNKYYYSVKVASDNIVLYSIQRREFEELRVKDFRNYLIRMCETKKSQRDVIFEQAKRDSQMRNSQLYSTSEKFFSLKNKALKNMAAKPALKTMSRQAFKDEFRSETVKNASSEPAFKPKLPQFRVEADKLFHAQNDFMKQMVKSQKEKDARNASVILNIKKQESELRPSTNQHNRTTDPYSLFEDRPDLKALQDIKLFHQNDVKLLRKYNGMISKFSENKPLANKAPLPKTSQSPKNIIMKEINKGADKFRARNESLFDIRNVIKTEEDIDAKDIIGQPTQNDFYGRSPKATDNSPTAMSRSPKASSSFFASKLDFEIRRSTTPIITNSFTNSLAAKHDQHEIHKKRNPPKHGHFTSMTLSMMPNKGLDSLEDLCDEKVFASPEAKTMQQMEPDLQNTLAQLGTLDLDFNQDEFSPAAKTFTSLNYGKSPFNAVDRSSVPVTESTPPVDKKGSGKGFSFKLKSSYGKSQTKKIKEYRNRIFKKASLKPEEQKAIDQPEQTKKQATSMVDSNIKAALLRTWEGN